MGCMKRLFFLVLSILGLSLITTPSSFALGDVTNFRISDFDIKYELSRDDEGRSRLKTVETITAQFPNFNQNHGIERAIPDSYDGHPVSLKIESVTNGSGSNLNYSKSTRNGNLVLRIGDADTYVHGTQTYVITYTQRDVTKTFSNTNSDEFYWDTNGTEWKVPIDRLNVSLTIDPSVEGALNGNGACYIGRAGVNDKCELGQDGGTFTTSASGLSRYENITIAVGFNKATFAAYQRSLWDTIMAIYIIAAIILSVVGVVIAVLLMARYQKWSNRTRDLGTIIPEYTPPTDTSLTTAASLVAPIGSVFTAQLLDFAVRHYIKIYQTSEKSFFKAAQYDIEISKDIHTLKPEEQEILKDIFQDVVEVGRRINMESLQQNQSVYERTQDNDKKLNNLVRGSYGLRERNPAQSAWFKRMGWVLLVLSFVLLNPGFFIAALFAFILGFVLWPLTDKGLSIYRYLEGLKLYIKVAEQERLAMLQSPDGAEKVGSVDVNDPGQLIKLYEKVLPYAVLFGQEKEWSKRIGDLYQSNQMTPDWYGGNTAFNAAVFSSAMSGFSSAASYSAASSSSSGGSSGGGSSGGGGGGGGGGGW